MALEKRLDAEKAEKAALAGDRKPKVKPEQVDDYREGAFDDGLQYEDPEADISDDERRYLQEEMDEMDDDECLIVTGGGDVASGSGSKKRAKSSSASSASKGKGRTSSSKSSGELSHLDPFPPLTDPPTLLQANATSPPTRSKISLLPPSSARAKARPRPPLPPPATAARSRLTNATARPSRKRRRPSSSTRIAIERGGRRSCLGLKFASQEGLEMYLAVLTVNK